MQITKEENSYIKKITHKIKYIRFNLSKYGSNLNTNIENLSDISSNISQIASEGLHPDDIDDELEYFSESIEQIIWNVNSSNRYFSEDLIETLSKIEHFLGKLLTSVDKDK